MQQQVRLKTFWLEKWWGLRPFGIPLGRWVRISPIHQVTSELQEELKKADIRAAFFLEPWHLDDIRYRWQEGKEVEQVTVFEASLPKGEALLAVTATYVAGLTIFDYSTNIETASDGFLGECGIEAITTAEGRAQAFEVWLFDKNDFSAMPTKVLMTQHSYDDDALRAELVPKTAKIGVFEAVVAEPGKTIILETTCLQVRVEIVEVEYGDDPATPRESYFEKLVVKMTAGRKGAP